MGGATRFRMLLAAPFPTLFLRRPTSLIFLRRLSSTAHPRRLTLSSSLNSSYQNLHTQPLNNSQAINQFPSTQPHPWLEWSQFNIAVRELSPAAADHGLLTDDSFVVYEEKELPEEFIRCAAACLAFARDRPELLGLLSRQDVEVIVTNGTPFLFKSALDTARRMRAYLGRDGSNASELGNANTVDIMKYILSYVSKPVGSSTSNGLFSRELVESSTRNLLCQITQELNMPGAEQREINSGYGQTNKPVGQHVQMKRGDWICQKCSFMNFARNIKCLECEEPRPKRQLTGGEWECPQCCFFNFGKNFVCLRCDCKRPDEVLAGNSLNKTSIGVNLTENEGKANRWFNKVSPVNNVSALEGIAAEQSARINSSASFPVSNPSEHRQPAGSNTRHVPFVPLPADMFAKKDQEMEVEVGQNSGENACHSFSSGANHELESVTLNSDSSKSSGKLEIRSGIMKNGELQDEKTERWFKRVAELNVVKDSPSAISDDDFPDMMPMRKGENRFVVSKKKDRSLTSSYRRQVAVEQGRNPDFVPFVPFPPGYFAKKDTKTLGETDMHLKPSCETSTSASGQATPEKSMGLTSGFSENDSAHETVDQASSSEGRNPKLSNVQRASFGENPSRNTSGFQSMRNESNINKTSAERNPSHSIDSPSGSVHMPEHQTNKNVGAGNSLEGSAVKETDPLDMSEEAKAERWFRRVAQIKDISELSQIPDEDFPSIMPMRKGVNRFVVSKRKTPLERRLTSPQYRRNLPTVSSDFMKENDKS